MAKKKKKKEDYSYILDAISYLDDKTYQRLELIIENKRFNEELKRVKDSSDRYDWARFCDRWHIESDWKGNVKNLYKFIRSPVEIYYDENWIDAEKALLIRITDWTTLEDISKRWKYIQKFQRKLLGKWEEKKNFLRDMGWYELNKKQGWSIKKIIEKEKMMYMADIETLVVRRIKPDIAKEDLNGKVLDDEYLRTEIICGFLAPKYKELFEQEKHYFLTGKVRKGNKWVTTGVSPLADLVKKAIRRMEKQIEQYGPDKLSPDEDDYNFAPPQRIG